MKYAIIAALLIVATVQAQPSTPVALEAVDGIATIAWSNEVGADTVIVVLSRPDCPVPTFGRISPNVAQQATQVPGSIDERCLLRPGDRVSLVRYKDGVYIDTIGPWIVPVRIYAPLVGRDACPSWQSAICS